LTDSGVKKIVFLYQIFKSAIDKLGVEKVIKRKVGLWPIIAGFKSLPRKEPLKDTFEIIERVRKAMGREITETDPAKREYEIVSGFLNLPDSEKQKIVENLFSEKYGG